MKRCWRCEFFECGLVCYVRVVNLHNVCKYFTCKSTDVKLQRLCFILLPVDCVTDVDFSMLLLVR